MSTRWARSSILKKEFGKKGEGVKSVGVKNDNWARKNPHAE